MENKQGFINWLYENKEQYKNKTKDELWAMYKEESKGE